MNVAHLVIIVRVRFEHVVQLVLPLFVILLPKIQICQCPIDVFVYLPFGFLVFKVAKLVVQVFGVHRNSLIDIEQLDPE